MKQFGIMVGLDKPAAFEGWFCKIDDKKNDIIISVIWGYSTHIQSRHAFIQFQDSIKHRTTYVRYAIEDLSWSEDPFVLRIGNNQLSQTGMKLDFDTEGFLMVLQHEGLEYRFTSIEGGRMLDFSADDISFTAVVKKGRLKMTIRARQSHPVALASPDKGEMKAKIKESIDGIIEIELEQTGQRIISLQSSRASIDVHFHTD